MRNNNMFSKKITININTVENAKKFNEICNSDIFRNADINVYSGRYIIDGKSIMGIFSLDLIKPVEVDIKNCSEVEIDAFSSLMRQFQE